MMNTRRTNHILTTIALTATALFLGTSIAKAATYTWLAYNNTTAGSDTFEDWGTAANWDGSTVFASGGSNDLVIFDDSITSKTYATGSTQLEQEGSITIQNVPSLTMGTLTLDGRGPNNPLGTAIYIGDNTATWTIGNGTTGTVNLTTIAGGGGDRYPNHTVNPNITLAQTTLFTGSSASPQGFVFAGNIGESAAGYGITKTGSSRLVFSGTNTYTGATTVNGGFLRLNSAGALPGNSALTINNSTIELGASDFTRNLGAGSTEFQITGGAAGFSPPAETEWSRLTTTPRRKSSGGAPTSVRVR
jgi:autotransporter-associated beta strand protein